MVVLAGPSGVGKSTWAKRLFAPTEIVSSDHMRALITDDENNQNVNEPAFSLVHTIVDMRLKAGRSVVIDSTALVPRDRKALLTIAKKNKVFATLIVFVGDEHLCKIGQKTRERKVPEKVIQRHVARLQTTIDLGEKGLQKEGFDRVIFLTRDAANHIEKVQWTGNDLRNVDVIGDVHGCIVELQMLLDKLGYDQNREGTWYHPEGRVAAFVGDFTDRGIGSLAVLRLVRDMQRNNTAIVAALGNHDWKLFRHTALERDVKVSNGMDTTLREIESEVKAKTATRKELTDLLQELFANAPNCTVLDSGNLVITHGAVKKGEEKNPVDKARRSPHAALCLYGQTTGEILENGKPERIYDWAKEWQDTDATVVFGHDVMGREPEWLNQNVVGIDTGCVFGGRLTALRWPSKEMVYVDALRAYAPHEKIV